MEAKKKILEMKSQANKKALLICLQIFTLDYVLKQKYATASQRKLL